MTDIFNKAKEQIRFNYPKTYMSIMKESFNTIELLQKEHCWKKNNFSTYEAICDEAKIFVGYQIGKVGEIIFSKGDSFEIIDEDYIQYDSEKVKIGLTTSNMR